MARGRPAELGAGGGSLLIVDDEAPVRNALEHMIAGMGWGVACTTASSVREALARCRLKHFDMALVDVVMPENDGIELLLRLKKLLPAMPVVVMTDGGRTATRDFLTVAQQLGADGTVWKPVDPRELRAVLEPRLAPRRASAKGPGEPFPAAVSPAKGTAR